MLFLDIQHPAIQLTKTLTNIMEKAEMPEAEKKKVIFYNFYTLHQKKSTGLYLRPHVEKKE